MIRASASAMPRAANAAATKRSRSSWWTRIFARLTNGLSSGGAGPAGAHGRRLGEIVVQPMAHYAPHPRIVFCEQEMVDVAERMQLGRVAGRSEQLDPLPGPRE